MSSGYDLIIVQMLKEFELVAPGGFVPLGQPHSRFDLNCAVLLQYFHRRPCQPKMYLHFSILCSYPTRPPGLSRLQPFSSSAWFLTMVCVAFKVFIYKFGDYIYTISMKYFHLVFKSLQEWLDLTSDMIFSTLKWNSASCTTKFCSL